MTKQEAQEYFDYLQTIPTLGGWCCLCNSDSILRESDGYSYEWRPCKHHRITSLIYPA